MTTSSFNQPPGHPKVASAAETNATALLEVEAERQIAENKYIAQPTITSHGVIADCCSDVISWSALPFDMGSSLEFVDPFHDDWAFWPKQEDPTP